jgi:hypothetical protein
MAFASYQAANGGGPVSSAVSHLEEFCYSITKLAGAKARSEIENAPSETDNGVPVGRPRKSTG